MHARPALGIVVAAFALTSFASAAHAAEASWHDAGALDLAKVPVVDVTPTPNFQRVDHGGSDHDWVLADAEHDTARAFAPTSAEHVHYEEPKRSGNLSVVVNDNLDYPTRNGLLRFFQRDPSAEAMTASCGLGPDIFQSVRSYALGHAADGGMRFAFRQAWFDYVPCKGELLRGFDTKLAPIANGLAFVYRTSCPTCEGGKRERLNVITPTALSLAVGAKDGEYRLLHLRDRDERLLGSSPARAPPSRPSSKTPPSSPGTASSTNPSRPRRSPSCGSNSPAARGRAADCPRLHALKPRSMEREQHDHPRYLNVQGSRRGAGRSPARQ